MSDNPKIKMSSKQNKLYNDAIKFLEKAIPLSKIPVEKPSAKTAPKKQEKKEFKLAPARPIGSVAKPSKKSPVVNMKITAKSVGLDVKSELTKFENNNQEEYNKIQNFMKKNEKKNFIYPLELTSFISKPNNEKIFKELKYDAKYIFDFYTLLANDIIENNDLKLKVLRTLDQDPKNISVISKKKLIDSIKKNPDIQGITQDKLNSLAKPSKKSPVANMKITPKKDDVVEGFKSMVKSSEKKEKTKKINSTMYKEIIDSMKTLLSNKTNLAKINQLADDGKSFGKIKDLKEWFDERLVRFKELDNEIEKLLKQNKNVKMTPEQERTYSKVQDFFESNRFYSN